MATIEELRKELARLIVKNGQIIFDLDDVEEQIDKIKDQIAKREEE